MNGYKELLTLEEIRNAVDNGILIYDNKRCSYDGAYSLAALSSISMHKRYFIKEESIEDQAREIMRHGWVEYSGGARCVILVLDRGINLMQADNIKFYTWAQIAENMKPLTLEQAMSYGRTPLTLEQAMSYERTSLAREQAMSYERTSLAREQAMSYGRTK